MTQDIGETPCSMGGEEAEFVTFSIGDRRFCVDIMSLREIRGWTPVTPLPDTPDHVLGVVNLRGTVLPIIDLSTRFGLKSSQPSERSIIMITNVGGRVAGLLADSVSDIILIDPAQVQPAPGNERGDRNRFIKGLVSKKDAMIGLIEVENILLDDMELAA